MSDRARDEVASSAAAAGDAEGRFRTIFEHSNDAIFLLDPAADAIVDANPSACRMLGYNRAELLALRISDVHPAEMHQFVSFARTVLDTGSGWTNELSCLTRSGTALPAEISTSVVDLDGRAGVVAMVRDISERKRTEAELGRYREQLERLVEERTAELARSEQRQRALVAIGRAIVANLDRATLFEAIARSLRDVLAVDRASLTLHDPAKDILTVYALAGPSTSEAFPVGVEGPRVGSHLKVVPGRAASRPVSRSRGGAPDALRRAAPAGGAALVHRGPPRHERKGARDAQRRQCRAGSLC